MEKKKLIEVALPLEAINTASSREKSIRHGHPSTFHLWWSRKPLATTRAVIWASLVDDPSSHPEMFPTDEEQQKERERLFKIIESFVLWDNANNKDILDCAKVEINRSTNGNAPIVFDPFAGGGSIPLEAQRLGLKACAKDLNPIAVMINKAMIEIPPRFAGIPPINPDAQGAIGANQKNGWQGVTGLATDIEFYADLLKKKVFEKIGKYYPKVSIPEDQGGGEATVIAWIWARTVKCPNPACGCDMPLVNSFVLSKKKGKEAYVNPEFDIKNKKIIYKVSHGKGTPPSAKMARGAKFKCIMCGEATNDEYIKYCASNDEMKSEMIAIIAEGSKGRYFISPDEDQMAASIVSQPADIPEEELPYDPRNIWCVSYGLDKYYKLYTNRQLTAITTFIDLLEEVQNQVLLDAIKAGLKDDAVSVDAGGSGALAYAEAVRIYLAFVIDRLVNYSSTLNAWSGDFIIQTYSRQALPMVWGFAESNPFSSSTGSFSNMTMWVTKCMELFPASVSGIAEQADSQNDHELSDVLVSTDPPYYDNIGYADLSDYFYVWMRRSLKGLYNDLFSTMLVPKAEELIATPYRHEGSYDRAKEFFERGMLKSCKQIFQHVSDEYPVTIYYAYKQSDVIKDDTTVVSSGWETMLNALIGSGFTITGTWPMHTERETGLKAAVNALASSIVLVCRKRDPDAQQITRRNLVNELKREMRPALKRLQQSNIAPVDLAQSAIGPGMAVFSKYSQVLEADGTPMTVRSALQIINQELDIYFNEQDGELDRESRFCVDLYTQNAFNDIKFGDADTLARAKNTSVATLEARGVVYAKKGVVHLLERKDIPEKVKSDETMIWLLTQQLTHAMETGGVEACAKIVFDMMGSNVENAKSLAYRLYTIAERKGWAQEAYAYNSLVISWQDIQSRAAQMSNMKAEQMSLFDN